MGQSAKPGSRSWCSGQFPVLFFLQVFRSAVSCTFADRDDNFSDCRCQWSLRRKDSYQDF